MENFVQAFLNGPVPLVFPIHPRTLNRLKKFKLYHMLAISENIQLLHPVGYFDFLMLMKNCTFILTDSGGLQEEATTPSIRKPILVLRASTERPEAIKAGFAKLVGVDSDAIVSGMQEILDRYPKLPDYSPFGDGKAGKHIIDIVGEFISGNP